MSNRSHQTTKDRACPIEATTTAESQTCPTERWLICQCHLWFCLQCVIHHLILRSVYTILYYMIPCVCPSALKVATLLTFQKLLKRQWRKTLILKLMNQQNNCSSSGLNLLGKLFSRLWEKFRSLCAHGLWSTDWKGIFFLWRKFPKKTYAMRLWKKERKKEKKT